MDVTQIYWVEVGAFFTALLVLLGYQMATGKISLRGLFVSGVDASTVNPERVLLFIATLLIAAVYIVRMMMGGTSSLPTLSSMWLVVFGISCLIYVVMKAFRTFSRKNQGE